LQSKTRWKRWLARMNVDFARALGSNPSIWVFRFYFFQPFFFPVSFARARLPSLSSHRPCLPSSLHHHSHLHRSSSLLFTLAVRVCRLLVFAEHQRSTLIHLFAEHHHRLFVFAGSWCFSAAAAMNPQQVSFIFCN